MNHTQNLRGSPIVSPQALSRTGWLSEQPADFQERMGALGRWQTFRAGEGLYDVGDEPNALFGLEDGLLDVAIPISDDEMVNLHRAPPGFWIGDSALLSGMKRAVSLTAYVDSLVFTIPAGALQRHLASVPQDMMYFSRLSHANTLLALEALAEVLALPPRARFARLLLRLLSDDGSVRATQTELGALAGMSRAAFRRSFAGLIDAGIVQTDYGKVRVLDRAALEEEANRS